MKFVEALKAFYRDEAGVAAIEYALLVALLAVAIVGAVTTLGEGTNDSFVRFNTELENAQSTAP